MLLHKISSKPQKKNNIQISQHPGESLHSSVKIWTEAAQGKHHISTSDLNGQKIFKTSQI
jgi:hypothetical protein